MKLRAKNGERLFRVVTIRLFAPGNKCASTRIHRARPGEGINQHGIDLILAGVTDQITKTWPDEEYGLVELSPCDFNFVWRAHRKAED